MNAIPDRSTNDNSVEPPAEEAVSLEQLAQVYAKVLQSQQPPEGSAQTVPGQEDNKADPKLPTRQSEHELTQPADIAYQADADVEEQPLREESHTAFRDDLSGEQAVPVSPLSILEALLFVGDKENRPLSAERIASVIRSVRPEEIDDLVLQLNRRYASRGCPYRIVRQDDGYRLVLHPWFEPVRAKFYGRLREARLSQAAIDCLAIVAYRQPISAEQVSQLRGAPSTHILNQLVQRRLLTASPPPGKSRPLLYRTTERFLQLFGLERLEDLPQLEDIDRS